MESMLLTAIKALHCFSRERYEIPSKRLALAKAQGNSSHH